MARSTRVRWLLLGGAAVLAFAVGVAPGMLDAPEPAPPPREPAPPAVAARPAQPRAAPAPRAPEAAPSGGPRAEIRAQLEADLAEYFPELKLSSDEVDAAADALARLRAARLELDGLPRTRENAERIEELKLAIGEAYEDFEYVVEVDPAEFSERVDEGFVEDEEDAPE
jgi:hypothetical protein